MANSSDVQKVVDVQKTPDALVVSPTTYNVTTYAELVSALASANNGDTINLAAGTYTGPLAITHNVTINGANAGIAGTGARGAESILDGAVTSNAGVVINGVEFLNTSNNATDFNALYLSGAGNSTITNSLFYSTGPNGNNDRAITMDTSASGQTTISNNYFTGASTGQFSTASWSRAIWSDGASSLLAVQGNTFEYTRTALNLDGFNNAATTISGNQFVNSGSGLSIGTPVASVITGITNNVFTNVGTDFNLRNVTFAQSLDLTATNNTGGGTGSAATLYVLGSAGADVITGSAGADILDARDSTSGSFTDTTSNTLNGAGGDDTLIGSLGADALNGGTGNDTAIVFANGGADTFDGGAGNDTLDLTRVGTVTATASGATTTYSYAGGSVAATGVENVLVTGTLTTSGGATDDVILTSAGNDIIFGNDGNDTIEAGAGNDQVYGGNGNDTIIGGDGAGDDFYDGGAGIDTLSYPSTTLGITVDMNEIDRSSNPAIAAILTNAGLLTTTPVGIATGLEIGTDAFRNIENVTGGSGADVIFGNAGVNVINGGGGDDRIRGGAGNDVLDGALGNDTLDYSDLTQAVQVNLISGLANGGAQGGLDSIANFENIVLGAANDQFIGSEGENNITGGAGDDQIDGRGGLDTFIYSNVTATDGMAQQAFDVLRVNAGTSGTDTLQRVERVLFVNGLDQLFVSIDAVGNALVASRDDTAAMNEGGVILTRTAATGVLSNDINLDQGVGDQKVVSAVNGVAGNVGVAITGLYGSLTLNADGSYTYVQNQAATDALRGGQIVNDIFAYTADDGDTGNSAPASLVIAITGINDAPVIGGTATGSVTEETTLTTTGTLTVTDVDTGEAAYQPQTTVGTYGTFTLLANGSWTYALNNAAANVQALGATVAVSDSFTPLTVDGTANPVTITVNGTNDNPVITGTTFTPIPGLTPGAFADIAGSTNSSFATAFNIDGNYSLALNPNITSSTTVPHVTISGATNGGAVLETDFYRFTVSAAGTVVFDIDNTTGYVNSFFAGGGDTRIRLFNSAFTQIGTNDDAAAVDAGSTSVANSFLSFAITTPGVYYVSVAAFNTDTTGGTYQLHVSLPGGAIGAGTNLPGDVLAETNAALSTSGNVAFSDVDTNDSPVAAYNSATGFAFTLANGPTLTAGQQTALASAFTIGANGAFTFNTPSPDFLGHDDVLTLTYTVTVTDQHGGSATTPVTITINGTNDAPVITSATQTATIAETNVALTASGAVTASDADNGDVLTYTGVFSAGSVTGAVTLTAAQQNQLTGGFVINPDGTWTYNLASPDYLPTGSQVNLTYTVTASDGHGGTTTQPVTITINGTNDAPVLGFNQGFGIDTSGISTADGFGTIARVASGTNGIVAPDGDGFYAVVTETDTGPFTRFGAANSAGSSREFVNNSQAEVRVFLDANWAANSSFQYTVAANGADGNHQRDFGFQVRAVGNGTIQIGASNGATQDQITSDVPNAVVVTSSGWYTLQHVFHNVGGVLSVDMNLVSADGTVILVGTLTNPVDTIPAEVGGTRYGWFTDISVPGGLAIDAVQLGDFNGRVTESSSTVTTSGGIPFTDVELSDTHTLTSAPVGSGYRGTFTAALTNDSTGDGHGGVNWSYTATAAELDSLAAGQVLTQSYTLTVADNNGGTASRTVVVTIVGTNDAPILTGSALFTIADTVAADSFAPVTGTIAGAATDVDAGDTKTFTLNNPPTSTYGTLTLNTNGTYSFAVDSAAVNGLLTGDTRIVTYSVTVADGAGATSTADFTITITGQNENPIVTISPLEFFTADYGYQETFDLLQGASDPDNVEMNDLDILSPSVTGYTTSGNLTSGQMSQVGFAVGNAFNSANFNAELGNVTINTSNFDFLDPGQSVTVTVQYTITDSNGGSVAQTALVTINGVLEFNNEQSSPYDDVVTGGIYGDFLNAGDGDDEVYGNAGADLIIGGSGDDYLAGGSGNDTIYGDEQSLFGGEGGVPTGDNVIDGGSGNDTIYGGLGNNTVAAGSGNDDIYIGSAGFLVGGEGGVEIDVPSGINIVDGGSGFDTVHVSGRWSEYTITRTAANTYVFERLNEDGTVEANLYRNVEYFTFDGGEGTAGSLANDAPTVAPTITFSTPETPSGDTVPAEGVFIGNVGASDPDEALGDTLTYFIDGSGANNFTIDEDGNLLLVNPVDFETGPRVYTLSLLVVDEHGLSDTSVITINITDANDPISSVVVTGGLTSPELAAIGTVVATAAGTDVDPADTISYTLSNNAGGRYAIDAITGVVTVANGNLLDFEQAVSHDITVVATSSDGSSLSQLVTIAVTDVSPETIVGTSANETFVAGAGADSFTTNITTGGADRVNFGAGLDRVTINADAPTNVLLRFTSAEVGNGNANDSNTLANQDGGLAVRVSDPSNVEGPVTRTDDEGMVFIGGAGVTFNVTDLPSGVSRGNAFEVAILGTSGADTLTAVQAARPYYFNAGGGNDSVTGGAANDFLVGGGGDDVLAGLGGNNSYIGGAGIDTVSYAAAPGGIYVDLIGSQSLNGYGGTEVFVSGIENVVGSANNDIIIGDNGNNVITGGGGSDYLIGRDGNDMLVSAAGVASALQGGIGNDTYVVANAGDSVLEFTGEGTDTVLASIASYTLNADVENLTYTGVASFTGGGNALDNSLTGGIGNDVLTGGAGADTFNAIANNGLDRITDFTSGSDRIVLDASYTHTATVDFVSGAGAQTATGTNSAFLYDTSTGILSYDADGTGAGAAVALFDLGAGTALVASDVIFPVIG